MYLYNKDNNMIEVYSVNYSYDELDKFRKEEMQKIPLDKRFYYAITKCNPILERPIETIKWRNLECGDSYYGDQSYHSISNYNLDEEEMNRQYRLLQEFYNESNSFNPTVKVIIDEDSKIIHDIEEDYRYFILTQKEYVKRLYPNDGYILPDILSVTKPLFLLQLFESRQFNRLKDENIDFLSSLLQVSDEPVEKISIEYLKRLENLGVYSTFSEQMSKICESQNFFQKLKRIKK